MDSYPGSASWCPWSSNRCWQPDLVRCAASLQVFRDPDHRGSLLDGKNNDLERQAALSGSWQLHRRPELGEEERLPSLLETLHDRMQDDERHPGQALELLVPVDASFQVDLPETLDADPLSRIDEVADLDRIAREERDRLEQAPAAGVFPGERLDEPGQLGIEEVDQWARHELRHAAAATLLELAALHDRPLVVALDVLQPRLVEERPERAVHHPVVPVLHVRIGPYDDVAARLVQGLPER